MCYMSETERRPAHVGVRELRQNLSVYLDRVKAGETLEVTEHGRPVARLTPNPPERVPVLDRLIAEGRAQPAALDHRTATMPTVTPMPGEPTLTEVLLRERVEDDR
jgi:prevent-host-death family protein